MNELDTIACADAIDYMRSLPENSVNLIVTSLPYWGLRAYAIDGGGEIGREPDFFDYLRNLTAMFAEARRVLRDDGNLYVNMGDKYLGGGDYGGKTDKQMSNKGSYVPAIITPDGFKPKNLLLMPHRLAIALQDDGWYMREDIVWHKPSCMPESVRDRCTRAHEYVFHLTKQARYYYDAEAIKEDAKHGTIVNLLHTLKFDASRHDADYNREKKAQGIDSRTAGNGKANKRSVWTVPTAGFPGAHFATFPEALIEPIILAACPPGGLVFDPFMGSGTTALVARRLGRHYIGCDLSAEYVDMARQRLRDSDPFQDKQAANGITQLSLFEEH